jgi:DNA-binding NarL/FixJ family response regulator
MIREHHPMVSMLVMADPVDGPFLEGALNLGICGIVWKPIPFDVAPRLIRTAHEACCDRHLLRSSALTGREAY